MKTRQNMRFIYATASLMLMTLLCMPAGAQDYINTPVEISTEKVKVNGQICYSHVVLERQTLYSISKAYEVSVEDIYKFNPLLKEEGLKKNSIIIIPAKTPSAPQQEAANEATKSEKKEKLFKGWSKPKEQPASSSVTAPRLHTAKWYEDLETIADLYGILMEDIMNANNLDGKKLQRGQKLIIPYPGEAIIKESQQTNSSSAQTENVQAPVDSTVSPYTYAGFFSRLFGKTIPVKATVILPLTKEDATPNRNSIDFYCGVLLAVYDMAEKGIDCNLNVLDMMDSETPVSIDNISDSDIIIGPISEADLTKMATIAPHAKAIISPLDHRAEQLTGLYHNVFQIPTPHKELHSDMINWIKEEHTDNDRIILITEKGARQTTTTSTLISQLANTGLAFKPYSYSILEGRDITNTLTAMMTTTGVNRVIVASESEAFVNDVVRNLNLLVFNKIDIDLFAPSKIRGFETIEVDNLHNTSLHLSLGYSIDYESDDVKNFLMKYRALFNTEPSQFSFQGYDITTYFLNLCSKHGSSWKDHVETSPRKMLQSTFEFRKLPSGSYVNSGIRRITYGDRYSVNKAN